MKIIETGHIAVDPDVLRGEPHIAGHRIGVSDVAIRVTYHGKSAEQIARELELSLGEVYAALAYYYDHKDAIDQRIAEADRNAEEMAHRYPHGWKAHTDGPDEHIPRGLFDDD